MAWAIYGVGSDHPKWAETFKYNYPGTVGHTIVITISWFGTQADGTPYTGTPYSYLQINPGQSGTFPPSFNGPNPTFDDRIYMNKSGAGTTMQFKMTWDDVSGPQTRTSRPMYWYCAC